MTRHLFTLALFAAISMLPVQAQNASWQSLGPIQFPSNVSGQINGIGRTTQIKFHPSESDVIFATTASGGLYRSDDLGDHWQVLGTDSMPHTQLASVCIDHTDDQVLYIGTGDPNYYFSTFGVWKSTDGGVTWNQQSEGLGNRMAVEMIMDPADHLRIVAATSNGIYVTTDGGESWQPKLSSGSFTDMKKHPANDSIYYAVTRSAFYRSTDNGETWTPITDGIAVPGGGDGLGIRLAVSPASPDVVYVGMIKDEGTIFRSNDAGESFVTVYHNPEQSLVGYDEEGGGQGNYNFGMCADPTNADIVYVVAHVVWKSVNGGTDWSKLTDWWLVVHTDMHGMEFSPYYPSMMYNINDGGIWLSDDGGDNWSIKSDGLEATEAVHAACSQTQPDVISIGTQDNGELYHLNGGWYTNRGGDWYSVMSFDCTPTGHVYYHRNLRRRNPITGGDQAIGLPEDQAGDNLRTAFSTDAPEVGFAGLTKVFRSQDLGESTPTWEPILEEGFSVKDICIQPGNANTIAVAMLNMKLFKSSNALDAVPEFESVDLPAATGAVASMAMDKSNSDIIYAALGTRVYRTYNGGANWENITGTLPPINAIRLVMDSARSDESVYLATASGVYYRNKNMSDWKAYNHGLPTIANITDLMIYDDKSLGRCLRVSYYGRGVFQTPIYSENSCPPPSEVSVSLDGIGALVSWTGTDSAIIQYRDLQETTWTTHRTGDSDLWLRWLEHCQQYEVRVAAQCSTEQSFFTLPVQFMVEGKTLPEIWLTGDIGGSTFDGYHCFNPAKQEVTITSAGSDVWDNSDQLYYISQSLTGDGEIVARMTRVENTHGWAKAGLMMREYRSPVSAHAMVCLTPGNGVSYQWRDVNAGSTSNTNIEGYTTPYWIKLVRSGDVFASYMSPDGQSWTAVENATIMMGESIQVGVFSCSHREGIPNEVKADHVSLFPLVTGLQEKHVSHQVSNFPNPALNSFTLVSSDVMISVSLTDLNGRLVLSQSLNASGTHAVDVSALPAGSYFMTVIFQDGTSVVKTIQKQHL